MIFRTTTSLANLLPRKPTTLLKQTSIRLPHLHQTNMQLHLSLSLSLSLSLLFSFNLNYFLSNPPRYWLGLFTPVLAWVSYLYSKPLSPIPPPTFLYSTLYFFHKRPAWPGLSGLRSPPGVGHGARGLQSGSAR